MYLAMLRCVNIALGMQLRMTDSGTRESEHPIHRIYATGQPSASAPHFGGLRRVLELTLGFCPLAVSAKNSSGTDPAQSLFRGKSSSNVGRRFEFGMKR